MSKEVEFIMGKNPVIEALKASHPINKIWIGEGTQKGQVAKVLQLAKENGVIVQHVPKRKLDQLVDSGHHQGVVASIAAYQYADMNDLFALAKERNEEPFFLVLDEVEDPHNLGSIIRTADAVGAHGVIIPKRRAVGLTQAVAKASTGAIQYVPVVRVTNLARTMDDLKKEGLWFAGTDAKGTDDYRQANFNMSIGLVIGSEGKGISRLIKEKCDFLVKIPMVGQVTSLNASVAASLLMYEVYRQRNPIGRG
ncbi:23S rRNA (guanosine(2251)-2'-O)-methyltransferase RlmB [Alkalihalophilus pseudofirmus]|uniref:23S rRNA (guanosine(2251)-2'-O)-methyltransferase RlmB n=1 Tax=Alkalihalobacterium alkalinitrilicum TaxID=427920 RepID=UPI00094DC27F|nr:23S rRNA (guanosine(2251)-2'-O)-methyltransferase RlmB [Alkalihalobacterium alkalinitrilicum]OLO27206.1 23S rRNA (guanosine(2251)-2'-O)-methyltransferase RlmB [Alkalihalophilus pseudofirmus]